MGNEIQINQKSLILEKEREIFDKIEINKISIEGTNNCIKILFKGKNNDFNKLNTELSKLENKKRFSGFIDEIDDKETSKYKKNSIKNIYSLRQKIFSSKFLRSGFMIIVMVSILTCYIPYFFVAASLYLNRLKEFKEYNPLNLFLYPSIPLIVSVLAIIIFFLVYISSGCHKYEKDFEQHLQTIDNEIKEKKTSIEAAKNKIIIDLIKDSFLINLIIDFCVLNEIKKGNGLLLNNSIVNDIKSKVINCVAANNIDTIVIYKNLLNSDQSDKKIKSLNSVLKSVEVLFISNLNTHSNNESLLLEISDIEITERDQKVQEYFNEMVNLISKNVVTPNEFKFNGDSISSLYINNKSSFGTNADYKEFCDFFSAPFVMNPQQDMNLTSHSQCIGTTNSPPPYSAINNTEPLPSY